MSSTVMLPDSLLIPRITGPAATEFILGLILLVRSAAFAKGDPFPFDPYNPGPFDTIPRCSKRISEQHGSSPHRRG